jgi:hypothetical protein
MYKFTVLLIFCEKVLNSHRCSGMNPRHIRRDIVVVITKHTRLQVYIIRLLGRRTYVRGKRQVVLVKVTKLLF